jgi:Domain of unknown function (DUF4214)
MSKRSHARSRPAARALPTQRLHVECLEERLLLAGNFQSAPVIPTIDAAMKAQLQNVYRQGQALGDRANVFSKVGDSNSFSENFLDPLGAPHYNSGNWGYLGSYTSLINTVAFFRAQSVDASNANSFNHASVATYGGWTSADVLTPGLRGANASLPGDAALPPLLAEIQETRPAFALVMLGTCEVGSNDTQVFAENLTTITQYLVSQGVIPVLSTIPDIKLSPDPSLAARVAEYNQIIADVAGANAVPLWNLSAALAPLPNQGLGSDEVHLNVGKDGSGNFASADMTFGMNMRNLTAVQVLQKLVSIVENNGPPDPAPAPNPSVAAAPFLTAIYQSILQRHIDSQGQAMFTQQLTQGYSAAEVVQEIWAAPEHRALQIQGYYHQFFHRSADAGGIQYWQQQFRLGLSESAIEAAFTLTTEYQQAHPNNTAYVWGLYEDLLQRTPGAGDIATWINQIVAGASQSDVATAIVQSQEANGIAVNTLYGAYLGRLADPAGGQYALGLLQDPFAGFLPLAQLLLTSTEYLKKHGA